MSIAGDHYRHGLRRLDAREVVENDRAASPLELLFDLTFVAAFGVAGSELAHALVAGHAVDGVVGFVVSMVTVVWAWINFTWFASAFDNDDWLFRVLTIMQMAGVVVVAIGLPPLFAAISEGGPLDTRVLVGGYVVMRVAVVAQWLRVARDQRDYRRAAITYAVLVGAAQLGWLLLAASPAGTAVALGAVGVLFAVESLGPVVAGVNGATRHGRGTPWHPRHIAERHVLLTIIALGETVLGTLASASMITSVAGSRARVRRDPGGLERVAGSCSPRRFTIPGRRARESRSLRSSSPSAGARSGCASPWSWRRRSRSSSATSWAGGGC